MTHAAVVRLHPLFPFSDEKWNEAMFESLESLRREGKSVSLARDEKTATDILFVAYEARDHQLIQDQSRLERLLNNKDVVASKVVLILCDVSKPKVTDHQLRQVLITQVTSVSQDCSKARAASTDDFRAVIQLHVSQHLTKAGLMKTETIDLPESSGPTRLVRLTNRSYYNRGAV